jgi:hypothetical protein
MTTPAFTTYIQTFTAPNNGIIPLTGALNVESFNTINFMVRQLPNINVKMTVLCIIGKISGQTIAQTVASYPLPNEDTIHTVPVTGPEFSITLTGAPPNTAVPIEAWVFLH